VVTRPALGDGGIYARSRVAPREITLQLDSHRRSASLPRLRAALLLYCRPEGGTVRLRYVGAVRTVEIDVYYVDGLDRLALRFIAPDPRWKLSEIDGVVMPGGAWGSIIPVGTAAAYPKLTMHGPGVVASLSLAADGTSGAGLFFSGVTLASGEILHCVPERMQFYTTGIGARQALPYLAPGSKPASFFFVPGVSHTVTSSFAASVTAQYTYIPRYWSWEDADV
jgi:hypothetical protein